MIPSNDLTEPKTFTVVERDSSNYLVIETNTITGAELVVATLRSKLLALDVCAGIYQRYLKGRFHVLN